MANRNHPAKYRYAVATESAIASRRTMGTSPKASIGMIMSVFAVSVMLHAPKEFSLREGGKLRLCGVKLISAMRYTVPFDRFSIAMV